jgi:hypothetical protein
MTEKKRKKVVAIIPSGLNLKEKNNDSPMVSTIVLPYQYSVRQHHVMENSEINQMNHREYLRPYEYNQRNHLQPAWYLSGPSMRNKLVIIE